MSRGDVPMRLHEISISKIMQDFILLPITLEQLQNVISEAVHTEFTKFNSIPAPEAVEYITRKETAQILGVSLVTLNEWTKTGTLQGYRIASRVRYKKTEVFSSLKKVQQIKFGRNIQ